MQRKLLRLWVFIPLLGSVTSVLASPVGQITQEQKNSESLNQIISIVIGGILTLILGYIQRTQARTTKRVETVESNSVPKEDHDALKAQIENMQTDLGILVTQKELVEIAQEQKKTTTAILEVAKGLSTRTDTVIETVEKHITAITDYRTAVNNSLTAQVAQNTVFTNDIAALRDSINLLTKQIKELLEDKAACDGIEAAINKMRDEIIEAFRQQQARKTTELPAVANVIADDATTGGEAAA